MRIKVVSKREEIPSLSPNEKVLHLAFRPSTKDFFMLVDKCPKLEVVQLPSSYLKMLSTSLPLFFENQRIKVIEGDVWGHRKDIHEYFEVSDSVYDRIEEMQALKVPTEEVIDTISSQSKLSPQLVTYIINDINT